MANPKYSAPAIPIPESKLIATLATGVKVKERIPRMRACSEKDEKGKLCAGHLKRFFAFGDDVKAQLGPNPEVYRCEKCRTLYVPNAQEAPRTGTLSW